MAFNKKTWKDRITQYPSRRTLTDVNTSQTQTVTVARNEGTVTEAGDVFNAASMNDLENRINNGFTDVNTAFVNLGWTLDGMVNQVAGSTANTVVKATHTTTKAYPEVWVIFSMNDSDNNNDNFCTVNSGGLQEIVSKRTYDSNGFNTWKTKFETLSGLTLTTTNYPFTYNFTWIFYRKNVPAGTTIEVQKNQYGRDIFMAVIGGGDGTGAVPVWAYIS